MIGPIARRPVAHRTASRGRRQSSLLTAKSATVELVRLLERWKVSGLGGQRLRMKIGVLQRIVGIDTLPPV